MKYMLLIYGNQELWESFPAEQFSELIRETDAQHVALRASGEFVGAYGVADQVMAKTVRLINPSSNSLHCALSLAWCCCGPRMRTKL